MYHDKLMCNYTILYQQQQIIVYDYSLHTHLELRLHLRPTSNYKNLFKKKKSPKKLN